MPLPSTCLLKFQIGPVQDFIAQARSTRDLWSASYLLSWLIAAGTRKLIAQGGSLIFPDPKGQPLLDASGSWRYLVNQHGLLTPNLPNIFVAEVPAEQAAGIAGSVKSEIEDEWKSISGACYRALIGQHILEAAQEMAFKAQVETFLSISWQITPRSDDYTGDYRRNGKHLDAVRQTRDFDARVIDLSTPANEKDSLSARDTSIISGSDALRMSIRNQDYRNLLKHDDHLSAITLVKRVWHLAYLVAEKHLHADSARFAIRSTRAIAARSDELDDEDDTDVAPGDKYLAAIAFDGDSIGKWVNGDDLAPGVDLRTHHTAFSAALSDFALIRVRDIVDSNDGFLIYAGGDDVVALTPADVALACANELREAFRMATASIKNKDGNCPDASAGIAIAHFKAPLQDLIRAAQAAEKNAKNEVGRPAFSITLMKRSGEISLWGAKWGDHATGLHDAVFKAMTDGSLRAKFPHRVCQLLEPYLTVRTGISKQADAIDAATARDLIAKEFGFAATRQGSQAIAALLAAPLGAYLNQLKDDPQTLFTSIIGLCTTLAFADRNRKAPPTAVMQSTAV